MWDVGFKKIDQPGRAIGFKSIVKHRFNSVFSSILHILLEIKRSAGGILGGIKGTNLMRTRRTRGTRGPGTFFGLREFLEIVEGRLKTFRETKHVPASSDGMSGATDTALVWWVSA